jgi:hypothetical protein
MLFLGAGETSRHERMFFVACQVLGTAVADTPSGTFRVCVILKWRQAVAKKAKAGSKLVTKKRAPKKLVKNVKGAPFSEQDPKRRLGDFSGAGEHPRQGGRTSGIVGQTTKRNHTDKRS